jgi:multidrug efflux pump subunit AcrA (membrane-fusion protein)
LEKLKIQQTLTHERLLKLVDDRTAMTVKAPCNGIVYYGKCARGKWGSATDPLHRGSTIMPNEVFMTIVEPRPLLAHVTVPEAQLQYLRGGLKAVVEPAGYSDQKLSGIVERVGAIPISAGSFDAQIALATDGPAEEALMPGMACTAKLVPWKKADDLAVPSKAVFSDDLDVQRRFVYVVAKKAGAKAEKREVTLGKRNDKQVEILSGLHAGEEILLERPKDEQ